jgi:hypothetical protein
MGEFAMCYREAGYRVLPLARGGKKPHQVLDVAGGYGGVHQASTDRQVLGRWWHTAPHANIGVATGGGLVVIDIDVKHGVNGYKSLYDEISRLGLVFGQVHAPFAETPSGGMHIWMRWPWAGGVPSRLAILDGVDVKGDGGYVVVPPSGLVMPRLEGGQASVERIVPYTWQHGCPCQLPEVTASLGEWLATAPASGKMRDRAAAMTEDGDLDERLARGLTAGSRNATVYRLACGLYRRYGTSGEGASRVADEIRAVWEKGDKSGFGWGEVATCLESARRFIERSEIAERAAHEGYLTYLGIRRSL